jgi:predicted ArsR family transcriptional regulator
MAAITPTQEAYLKIKDTITERMNEVLEVIGKIQPCTYEDIADTLKTRTNLVTNRLHELEKTGLIRVSDRIKQKGNTRSLFVVCNEDETKELQEKLFLKYRTEKEDLEAAFQYVQDNPAAKDIIKRRVVYCKYKLLLLNKYAI